MIKNKLLSIICLILITCMAFLTTGCKDKADGGSNKETASNAADEKLPAKEFDKVLGKGKTSFVFAVIDDKGNKKTYKINTDQQLIVDALLEVKLIDGEKDDSGIFIKTVDGLTFDFSKDGKSWVFYKNDNYAKSGVNRTPIDPTVLYSLRVE